MPADTTANPDPDEHAQPSARSPLTDFAAGFAPDVDPTVVLDGLRAADRAIQSAAGAAIRGAADLLGAAAGAAGDAVPSVDYGAIAGAAAGVAGDALEASADVAGEVLGALIEGLGDALT